MRHRNWSKAGLLILILIASFFLPYVIRGGFHMVAERIEHMSDKVKDEEETELSTETEPPKGASIEAKPGKETDDGIQAVKGKTVKADTFNDDVCFEKKAGLTGTVFTAHLAMFKTTLQEYLNGITNSTCEIDQVMFLEKYEKRDKAYRAEIKFTTNNKHYTEDLICEYDSDYQFYRIYPAGLIEE